MVVGPQNFLFVSYSLDWMLEKPATHRSHGHRTTPPQRKTQFSEESLLSLVKDYEIGSLKDRKLSDKSQVQPKSQNRGSILALARYPRAAELVSPPVGTLFSKQSFTYLVTLALNWCWLMTIKEITMPPSRRAPVSK